MIKLVILGFCGLALLVSCSPDFSEKSVETNQQTLEELRDSLRSNQESHNFFSTQEDLNTQTDLDTQGPEEAEGIKLEEFLNKLSYTSDHYELLETNLKIDNSKEDIGTIKTKVFSCFDSKIFLNGSKRFSIYAQKIIVDNCSIIYEPKRPYSSNALWGSESVPNAPDVYIYTKEIQYRYPQSSAGFKVSLNGLNAPNPPLNTLNSKINEINTGILYRREYLPKALSTFEKSSYYWPGSGGNFNVFSLKAGSSVNFDYESLGGKLSTAFYTPVLKQGSINYETCVEPPELGKLTEYSRDMFVSGDMRERFLINSKAYAKYCLGKYEYKKINLEQFILLNETSGLNDSDSIAEFFNYFKANYKNHENKDGEFCLKISFKDPECLNI